MVKLLSYNTGPSFETLAQIEFIKALNARGIKAELYGDEHWPAAHCAFKPLSDFRPQLGDVIINDGVKIQSYFGAINLGFARYSHGRKKRLVNIFKYILNYLTCPIWLIRNLKFILYKKDRHQTSVCLYKHDLPHNSDLNFQNLIAMPADKDDGSALTIYADIEAKNSIHEKIKSAQASTVILAGAIREPLYFAKEIIPLINTRTKNLQYVGISDDILKQATKSENFASILNLWIEKIKK